jgi:lysylphosphatidylglycerol synthetase-like protein (DUF2156 family)
MTTSEPATPPRVEDPPISTADATSARPPAGRAATTVRLVLGLYFFAMVLVNLFVMLPNARDNYAALADLTWPGFVWVPEVVIDPVAVPFTLLLIVWEVAVGLLLLSRGRAVRLGLWAALFQVLALAPFLGWYEIPNLLTAAVVVWLLRRTHERTAVEIVRSLGRRRA